MPNLFRDFGSELYSRAARSGEGCSGANPARGAARRTACTITENIFTGGAKGIFTGGQAHRLYQGSVQNGPQYRRSCLSRL